MKLPTFRGGTHPPDFKSLTEGKEIENLFPAGDLVFPMSQHLGVPCVPAVKKGDRVLAGQKIADTDAFFSSPILSSVSGTVKDVGMRMTIPGSMETCVTIQSDGEFEHTRDFSPHSDFRPLTSDECIRIIHAAGIVGMGGAAFPTHIKLSPPPDRHILWVIVNGAECEPFLNCDNRLMIENPEQIIGGLEICLHIFPDAVGVIAVENNKPDAIASLKSHLPGRDGRISVMPHEAKYPQGSEKMLIYTVTGQEIPSSALPADVGCIVLNVGTLYSIWDAITNGVPLIDRVISVTGDVIADPKNIRAPLGTSVRELIDAAGGFTEDPFKILSGGPMMGLSMRSVDVPVVKGTSGILSLSKKSAFYEDESNCIRCGRCITACPMGLLPQNMDRLARGRDYEGFKNIGGMNCIECGGCAYVCPARRYLTQAFRDGKAGVMMERRRLREKDRERSGNH